MCLTTVVTVSSRTLGVCGPELAWGETALTSGYYNQSSIPSVWITEVTQYVNSRCSSVLVSVSVSSVVLVLLAHLWDTTSHRPQVFHLWCLSLSLSLCLSHAHALFSLVSSSIALSVFVSLSLSLSRSLPPCFPHSLCPLVSLLSLSFFLSFFVSLFLPLSPLLSPSFALSLSFSLSLSLPLSLCLSLPISLSPCLFHLCYLP